MTDFHVDPLNMILAKLIWQCIKFTMKNFYVTVPKLLEVIFIGGRICVHLLKTSVDLSEEVNVY